jgi:uncharacterized Tic20 family protein
MPKTRSSRVKAAADAGSKSKFQLAMTIITITVFALDGVAMYMLYTQYVNGETLDVSWFITLTIIGFALSITSEIVAAAQRYKNNE